MAAFDESELEVAQILLLLPHLIFDSEIGSAFALAWGSKKRRAVRRFAPLSGWKTPVSLPNPKLIIALMKRKRSENRRQKSSRCGGTKERSCFSAVKDESSCRRHKVKRSSNSSGRALLIPDLNLPWLIEAEEENRHEHEAHKSTLLLSA